MAKFSFFANRHGRKVFRTAQFCGAAFLIVFLSSLISVGVFALIAQRWNPLVPLLGLGAGIFVTLVVLLFSWMTPLQRLPMIR